MKKEEILKKHGLTEDQFYKLYPTEESYINAMAKLEYGTGGPIVDAFNSMPPDFANPMYFLKKGGMPCFECGGQHMEFGGFNSALNYGSFSVPMQQGGTAPQGYKQDDVISEKTSTFLNHIKTNTAKALMKEHMEELAGMKAEYGRTVEDDFMPWYKRNYNVIPYQQSYHRPYQGMEYFPLNYSPYYKNKGFSKREIADLQAMSKQPGTSYLSGVSVDTKYGPMDTFLSMFRGKDKEGNKKHTFAPKSHTYTYTFNTPFDPYNKDAVPAAMNNFMQRPPKTALTERMNSSLLPFAQNGYAVGTEYVQNVNGYPVSADDLYGVNQQIMPMQFADFLQQKPTSLDVPDIADAQLKPSNQFMGTQTQVSIKDKRRWGIDPEQAVNWGLAGAEGITAMLNANQYDKRDKELKKRMAGDRQFMAVQGTRGDYEVNSGMFRPDQMVPVQFTGMNLMGNNGSVYSRYGGAYQFGGPFEEDVQELTEEEIDEIIRNGGEVEYLD